MDVSATHSTPHSVPSPAASHLATSFADAPTAVLERVAKRLGIGIDRLRSEIADGRPLAHIAMLAEVPPLPPVSQPKGQLDLFL